MPVAHYLDSPVQHATNYPIGESDGSHLTALEREILGKIPTTSWSLTARPHVDYMNDTRTPGEKAREWTPAHLDHESAIIVWRGEFGIEMGAVRSRHEAGRNGYREDTFEASPFPGGWSYVPISRVLLVRHPVTI